MADLSLDMNGIGEEVNEDADGNVTISKTVPLDNNSIKQMYEAKINQIAINEQRIKKLMDENKAHQSVVDKLKLIAIDKEIELVEIVNN